MSLLRDNAFNLEQKTFHHVEAIEWDLRKIIHQKRNNSAHFDSSSRRNVNKATVALLY